MKKIAIIIPHYNGVEILKDCLNSLKNLNTDNFKTYIVDNNSSDLSAAMVKVDFPDVKLFSLKTNLGYSGGCNYGFDNTNEEYVLFLNNDTVQEENFLDELLLVIDNDESIAAVQPKIKYFFDREMFDYSGACGGELDYLGYPFTRGRIFDDIEQDLKQYDNMNPNIFWASGTAILVRRLAIAGECFDTDFFAHMEEIDLSWRLQLSGFKIQIVTKSVIYHYSGYTLNAMSEKKMYLNHRNNMLMIYKNLSDEVFYLTFFKRYLLECVTLFYAIIKLDKNRFLAVLKAHRDFFRMRKNFKEKRSLIQKSANHNNIAFYKRSIVLEYFLRKKKRYSDLLINKKSL